MPEKMKQTDEEFAAACGFAGDHKAGQAAINIEFRLSPRIEIICNTANG